MRESSLMELPKELSGYCRSEQRAILVHRYFLGIEWRREPSIAETVASWEGRFARNWRRKKVIRDLAAQLTEIETHKYYLSQKAGRDVGWEAAAKDWIIQHAGTWREWWERQPASSP